MMSQNIMSQQSHAEGCRYGSLDQQLQSATGEPHDAAHARHLASRASITLVSGADAPQQQVGNLHLEITSQELRDNYNAKRAANPGLAGSRASDTSSDTSSSTTSSSSCSTSSSAKHKNKVLLALAGLVVVAAVSAGVWVLVWGKAAGAAPDVQTQPQNLRAAGVGEDGGLPTGDGEHTTRTNKEESPEGPESPVPEVQKLLAIRPARAPVTARAPEAQVPAEVAPAEAHNQDANRWLWHPAQELPIRAGWHFALWLVTLGISKVISQFLFWWWDATFRALMDSQARTVLENDLEQVTQVFATDIQLFRQTEKANVYVHSIKFTGNLFYYGLPVCSLLWVGLIWVGVIAAGSGAEMQLWDVPGMALVSSATLFVDVCLTVSDVRGFYATKKQEAHANPTK